MDVNSNQSHVRIGRGGRFGSESVAVTIASQGAELARLHDPAARVVTFSGLTKLQNPELIEQLKKANADPDVYLPIQDRVDRLQQRLTQSEARQPEQKLEWGFATAWQRGASSLEGQSAAAGAAATAAGSSSMITTSQGT